MRGGNFCWMRVPASLDEIVPEAGKVFKLNERVVVYQSIAA